MLHFIVQPLIILLLIGIDFVIILEMYYELGYLIWVILLPQRNFMSGLMLQLIYIIIPFWKYKIKRAKFK